MAGDRGFSEEVWAFLKANYESGRYDSITEMYDAVSPFMKKCPVVKRVQNVSSEQGWKRGSKCADVQRLTAERVNQMFADQGMPDTEFVKTVIEGIRSGENIAKDVVESLKADMAEGFTIPKQRTFDLIRGLATNQGNQIKWVQEANRMRGGHAPTEQRHDAAGQPNVQNDEAANAAYRARMALLSGSNDG